MSGVTASRATEAPAWLVEFYERVDALDTEAVLARFAPDASMRYGSMEPMVGQEALRGGLTWLFTYYTAIRHEFRSVWVSGATVLIEATVTYGHPDGREVALPVVSILEHRDGIVDDLRIFLDPTPIEVA
jgi:ketosteroid isomerase-like protein